MGTFFKELCVRDFYFSYFLLMMAVSNHGTVTTVCN